MTDPLQVTLWLTGFIVAVLATHEVLIQLERAYRRRRPRATVVYVTATSPGHLTRGTHIETPDAEYVVREDVYMDENETTAVRVTRVG